MASPKVAIFSSAKYVRTQMAPLVERFPGSWFIDADCSTVTAPLSHGADIVCLFVNDDADAQVIGIFKENGVKMIALRCAGFDRVDLKAAEAAGIRVARVPAYSPYAVAEHALSLALCLNRKLHRAYNRVREGNFMLSGLVGMDMNGKTAGIIGTGIIGYIAATLFKGIGMTVICYDVYKNQKIIDLGLEYVELDEVYARSDVISVHVPLLPATYHIINDESIAKMKDGVILINVSRGGLMNTEAVINGLQSGKLGSLGVDVYEHEAAIFFKDHSATDDEERMRTVWNNELALLRSFPNCIITPHSAFLTKEALTNICNTTILNCQEFIAGGDMKNEVKPKK